MCRDIFYDISPNLTVTVIIVFYNEDRNLHKKFRNILLNTIWVNLHLREFRSSVDSSKPEIMILKTVESFTKDLHAEKIKEFVLVNDGSSRNYSDFSSYDLYFLQFIFDRNPILIIGCKKPKASLKQYPKKLFSKKNQVRVILCSNHIH